MKSVHIAYNPVAAVILNPEREVEDLIQQLLSYMVAGAEQTDAFQNHSWDGRSSFYEMRKHRFPAGFVPIVVKMLKSDGYQVALRKDPLPMPLGPERPIFDEYAYNDERYVYQAVTSDLLVKHGRMVAQIATGGGKSRIAQIATARIGRPTLFLTTRQVLMYQMKGHYENMLAGLTYLDQRHTVGVLGDSTWDPRKWINVGMVQTLNARLKPPSPFDPKDKQEAQLKRIEDTKRILERFEFVILEEAHEAGGEGYYEILRRCRNAHYRLGLTATPFMKEDEESNMMLMGACGPIGIRVSEQELIEKGILAKPIFKYITPDKASKFLLRTTPWQAAYRLGVVESVPRNTHVLRESFRAVKKGLSVLILVQRKKHGQVLQKALKSNDIKARFIYGETDMKIRSAALKALETGELQVLIGTNILDVGVDVPALGMVILAGGGKAEVQLRQRIGRGLRAKKVGPNVCYIVDFEDRWNKHLHKHSIQRRKIVEDTPGFVENILPNGEDFNFGP